jgi:predicted DNA-binding transcriptional regulator AlpA
MPEKQQRPELEARGVVGEPRQVHPITPRPAVASPPIERLALRIDGVAASLGVSKRTIQRLLSAGKFPRPDAYAGKCPLWTRATLERWLAEGGGRI